jgi:hypothetical protein
MSFRDIARQHLVIDKVEVPNWKLQELPKWRRLFKRQVFHLRYLPKAIEVELRQRYGSPKPLADDEQLRIWKALDALKNNEAGPGDLQVLSHYQVKMDNADLTAALFATVIVKPKLTPEQAREFIRGLDKRDWANWITITGKYMNLTDEEIDAIKNWSAPRASPSSVPSSTQMEGASGSSGLGRTARSDSSSSSNPSPSGGLR